MKRPKKLNLANIPTPFQTINYNGCTFQIKRDDFTGLELSGNKIRKLEYLLFDAKRKKSDYIFTCGGEQSNHCRATVIAASSLGIKSKVFLWGKEKSNADGNLFFKQMSGADFVFLNREEYDVVDMIMQREKKIMERKGKKVYIIPEGGSSELGVWGYITFFDELKDQISFKNLRGVLTAAGTGGTAAGLLIGAGLNKLKIKIYAVNVLYPQAFLRAKILAVANEAIEKFKLDTRIDEENLVILDGYSKEGYKKIQPAKVKVIKDFYKKTGILFDPAYTGKAFYAFDEIFLKGKKKSNVLFLHTGGLFGTFPKRKEYLESK